MRLAKSTYYFEVNKVDVVKSKNVELMSEIQEIFDYVRQQRPSYQSQNNKST